MFHDIFIAGHSYSSYWAIVVQGLSSNNTIFQARQSPNTTNDACFLPQFYRCRRRRKNWDNNE